MQSAVYDPYAIDLERFQGPLDLLLHLIRKQDIDVFDIPISRITEQFLSVIANMERLELERAGEFLEMAAILVRIKAQMLFPRHSEEEEDDPRSDLVRRLLEYEHFREAARLLERSEAERARHLPKGYVPVRPSPPASSTPLESEWDDVWQALQVLVDRLTEPEPGYRFSGPLVRIEDKIDLVLTRLRERKRVEFGALVAPWETRGHAVVSLLACLELAKRSMVRLQQASPFSPVWVHRREQPEA